MGDAKKKKMKVAIYNPYLDTLGGGERYTASVIKAFERKGFEVDIEWGDKRVVKDIEKRFGLEFKRVQTVDSINKGKGYEACFWISDGSIPLLYSKKNFLHFQVPFTDVRGRSVSNKIKLTKIDKIICNSKFTKGFIDKEYGVKSIVLYPPVSVGSFKPQKKEKIILYVGRFSQLTQAKRQDVLVEAFKKLYKHNFKDWKMVLAGGAEVGADEYLKNLKEASKGYPIEIIENPSFKNLVSLYGKAKIFWSASGYGINEKVNPEKTEHFGITVVEAMASGAVPIVYNTGGHKETVKENCGYLWNEMEELTSITKNLIRNSKLLNRKANTCPKESNRFNEKRFIDEFTKLI